MRFSPIPSTLAFAALCLTSAASAQTQDEALRARLQSDPAALAHAGPRDAIAAHVLADVETAQTHGGMERDAYPLARALSDWTFAHSRFDLARRAWKVTATLADGSENPPIARSQALYAETAAILADATDRIRPHLSQDDANEALAAAQQAITTISPLASITSASNAPLTPEEQTLAQAGEVAQRRPAHSRSR